MKVPRNAACPCGSGRKYKRCCGGGPDAAEHNLSQVARGPASRVCNFSCARECAELCCGGATLITITELTNCYDVFPVSVGFRKHTPLDASHRDFLSAVGTAYRGRFIVGDFIAGNRHAARCAALSSDSLCSLHGTVRKPAQCRLVPFSALYPEAGQDILFAEQRRTKFSRCRGFGGVEAEEQTLWREGRFVDLSYRKAYHDYQAGALRQASLMREFLDGMISQEAYADFLGGEGILEMPIPAELLPRVLDVAGVPTEEYPCYIETQWRLCRKEAAREDAANPVLGDCARELERLHMVNAGRGGRSSADEGVCGTGGE